VTNFYLRFHRMRVFEAYLEVYATFLWKVIISSDRVWVSNQDLKNWVITKRCIRSEGPGPNLVRATGHLNRFFMVFLNLSR
jgi:hypothetical protein